MTSPDGPVTADVAVSDDEFEELCRAASRNDRSDTQFLDATVSAVPGAILVRVELTWPFSVNRLYVLR